MYLYYIYKCIQFIFNIFYCAIFKNVKLKKITSPLTFRLKNDIQLH